MKGKIITYSIQILVVVFILFLVVGTLHSYTIGAFASQNNNDNNNDNDKPYPEQYFTDEGYPYQFVKCPDSNNIYPEGTSCDSNNHEDDGEPLKSTQKDWDEQEQEQEQGQDEKEEEDDN